jgi:hypothetical protein
MPPDDARVARMTLRLRRFDDFAFDVNDSQAVMARSAVMKAEGEVIASLIN